MVWATAASSRPTVGFTGVGTSPTITLSVANETFPGIVAFQNEAGEKIVRGSGGADKGGRGERRVEQRRPGGGGRRWWCGGRRSSGRLRRGRGAAPPRAPEPRDARAQPPRDPPSGHPRTQRGARDPRREARRAARGSPGAKRVGGRPSTRPPVTRLRRPRGTRTGRVPAVRTSNTATRAA